MLDLRPGTLVSGNLKLVRPLGQGGMGSVWLAQHLSLDMEVAVKFVRPERATDPSLLQRFEREAKAAARISSPHVVQIKDYGMADEATPYIVMERLRGESLRDVIERHGRLSLQQVAAVVAGIGKALSAAHELGIVHRDIKPQNVFLALGGSEQPLTIKVLDFGVAKVVGDAQVPAATEITETGMVIGSPPYMSPEQLEGRKDVDHRADGWSLGVVAYRALSGALPFAGSSFIAVGAAVLGGRYTAITTRRPELPPELDHWFAKALCVQPQGRYQSASEQAEAFARLVEALPPDELTVLSTSAMSPPEAATTTAPHRPVAGVSDPLASTVTAPASPAQVSSETGKSITMDSRAPGDGRRRVFLGVGAAAVAALALIGVFLRPDPPAPTTFDPKPPVVIQASDCPGSMRFVTGGSFDMGSAAGDDVRNNETPRHRVEVGSFCLDPTEVTVADYTSCSACGAPPDTVDGKEITTRAQQFWSQFCNAGRADRQTHPMNCVSWEQAQIYCQSRGRRLPTEQEWELAARGLEGRAYPWGNTPPSASRINGCGVECSRMLSDKLREIGGEGWASMYSGDDGAAATAAVQSFAAGATPDGVHDLAGNVWEWTASSYCYYDEPGCGESRRVLRGGGWDVPDPNAVRATRRHPGVPNGRGHNIGFRCAWAG